MPNEIANNMADTINQLDKELKDLREENKVLIRDCLRLIKANGKLRKKLGQIAKYKRLLKAAVEDLNATVADVYNGDVICKSCKWVSQTGECCCSGTGGCDTDYRWRYADEALKLIEG
jgi:regulator of replication initiation timing